MTKMGRFTYYKLQPETQRMQVNESLTCEDGDFFVFADGVIVAIQNNKLVELAAGETYIQNLIAANNAILSYKLIVE